jgi:hypothetical protein
VRWAVLLLAGCATAPAPAPRGLARPRAALVEPSPKLAQPVSTDDEEVRVRRARAIAMFHAFLDKYPSGQYSIDAAQRLLDLLAEDGHPDELRSTAAWLQSFPALDADPALHARLQTLADGSQ